MILIISMTVIHFIVFLFVCFFTVLCDFVTSCSTVFFSDDKINTGNLLHHVWLGQSVSFFGGKPTGLTQDLRLEME